MKFLLSVLFMTSLMTACSSATDRTVASENTDATVMITNIARNSGGSGVVIQSNATESLVLTNGHVCAVVKGGGLITGTSGISAFVTHYKLSKVHDLCLISVSVDLQARTRLADSAPKRYDVASISGHPKLLPNIVTFGHFSDKRIVQVMMGARSCTKEEYENPDTAFFCLLVGKLPIVRTFEAIVVSATIQPGSSGSGVFNSDHKLAALVFAGSGDLGYTLAVPYEYINFFINQELATLPLESPSTILGGAESEEQSSRQVFAEACKEAKTPIQKNICQLINKDTIYIYE